MSGRQCVMPDCLKSWNADGEDYPFALVACSMEHLGRGVAWWLKAVAAGFDFGDHEKRCGDGADCVPGHVPSGRGER